MRKMLIYCLCYFKTHKLQPSIYPMIVMIIKILTKEMKKRNSKLFLEERSNRINKRENLKLIEKSSVNLINFENKFDLIWVDGAHFDPIVTMDIINSINLLNDKGLILCDDIRKSENNATWRVINTLKKEGIIDYSLILKWLDPEHNANPNFRSYISVIKKLKFLIVKISFGLKIKHEPWGGGNQFLSNIIDYFKDRNVKIINHLNDKDIDIIVLMDPRYNSSSSTFNHFDIEKYLKKINKNAIVVHRVNECDERKGTKYVNKNLIDANKFADHTVFISSWLKNILSKYKEFENSSIILNGANSKIFNYSNYDKNN